MGYITKDIAVITEPKTLSLSAAPNFVQFASKPAAKTFLEATIKINVLNTTPDVPLKTVLMLTEPSGAVHIFKGTTNAAEVSDSIFFVSSDKSDTAENLREAMLNNRWISANFEVRIAAIVEGGNIRNGETLNIKSKGTGADFNITLAAPNNAANVAYTITWINATSTSNDSISGEAGTVEIELDIYDAPLISVNGDDQPTTPVKLGTQGPNLQKTYAGVPLWFELNALFSQYGGFKLPSAAGWFDAGTLRAYRFAAKVRAANSFTFYQSSALYVLNGYGRPSEDLDLSQYIFGVPDLKLLTNKPRTPYVKGQKEYLNFIFKTDNNPNTPLTELSAVYRAYTTSDVYLGTIYGVALAQPDKPQVCTHVLDIDAVINAYPLAGIVRVALSLERSIISNDQEYTIRPECLHDLQQVSFINRLGGWDSFNFEKLKREEVKPDSDTYNKNITPTFKKGDSVETVYRTSLEDTVTIEGAPVSDAIADWLKELAAASVVIDGDGYYIIKDEFTLNATPASRNMQVPSIKYRLSETYTNG